MGLARGSAEFDLLGVGNCGMNLSICIFISAIMAVGRQENMHVQDTGTHMAEPYGIILVGHAGLLSNWEGTWGELLACLIDPMPRSMGSAECWPRHQQDLGSDPGFTH